jgi:ribosomal protein S18 acetylase RimI-like enzyme
MEIIKTKDIKKLQISELYSFFNKLPTHGFLDFSKDKKHFKKEITDLINDKKYRFAIEYENNKITNYFLIKNEDSLKRSIVMTYDLNKIKNNIKTIKDFTNSNKLEIGIRNFEKNQITENYFFDYLKTYNFMKLKRNKLFPEINEDISVFESINHKNYYKDLVTIQNDCFADQYGYEVNNLPEFKLEIQNLEKRNINSFFEISKNNSNTWLGYVWTQLNLENNEGRLSMCGVKKEYRSKGIAKPLIISALNYLIKNNCELIYLEVDNENKPAKKIYKSLGFTKYSELNWFNIKY